MQSISNVSYHAAGANYNSIGICLVGNFDIENPTDAQMKTAVELVKEIKQNMRIKG